MNYYSRLITWMIFSLALSMALTYFFSALVPGIGVFIGLAVAVCVFLLISMYIRKKAFRGAVGGGMFGGGINYVCIACGHRFKGGSCPRCGSKMRRAEF
jgi:hypothetical protein